MQAERCFVKCFHLPDAMAPPNMTPAEQIVPLHLPRTCASFLNFTAENAKGAEILQFPGILSGPCGKK